MIIEIIDKSGRRIRLTEESWKHISKHPHVHSHIEWIKETLQQPARITDYSLDENVRYYYRYYKERASSAKYLRIIVKYLTSSPTINGGDSLSVSLWCEEPYDFTYALCTSKVM